MDAEATSADPLHDLEERLKEDSVDFTSLKGRRDSKVIFGKKII